MGSVLILCGAVLSPLCYLILEAALRLVQGPSHVREGEVRHSEAGFELWSSDAKTHSFNHNIPNSEIIADLYYMLIYIQ